MTKSLLYKSAFILSISSLLSRVLGVVRDHLLANIFGTGGEGLFNLDIYYAAFRIPDFIYALLIMGTISAAFVPVLSDVLKGAEDQTLTKKGNEFTSSVLNLLLFFVLISIIIAFIFTPYILQFLVPGFNADDLLIATYMTRIMLFSPLFFCISSVLQAVQNAYDKFYFYALAPILYNLSIIFGIYFFAEDYGIVAVSFSVVIGALFHFLIQIPGVWTVGFRFQFLFIKNTKHLIQMLKLVVPRIIGMSIMQINLIFDTMVASLLTAGSITIMNYAVNLNSLPLGMVGVSFAIASFASLSKFATLIKNSSDKVGYKKFADHLGNVIISILYFVIPLIVGLFIFRFKVVELVLYSGEFTEKDVVLTANTLAFFLIGLTAQSLIPVIARAFYSLKNTIIPVVISVLAVILNITLNFYLAFNIGLGVYGIALATSIASIFNLLLLIILLKTQYLREISFIQLKKITGIVFASLMMGVVIFFIRNYLFVFFEETFLQKVLILIMSTLFGMIVFLIVIYPFKLKETQFILRKLKINIWNL